MEKEPTLDRQFMEILGTGNVYFQPPESIKLRYPCIVYAKDGYKMQQADNKNYIISQKYSVTVIYEDPDENISKRILEHFSKCSFDRTYKADNLYHDNLILYY